MISPFRRIGALFISTVFLFGCVEDKDYGEQANSLRPQENQNQQAKIDPNSNSDVAEDSEIKLGELVTVPFDTEQDAVWREDELPADAGGGKRLIAVFRFSKENGEKLREQLSEKGTPFDAKVDPESWFPAELIARSATTGDEILKGKGYNASSFARRPYKSGTLVHIDETDYYVLTLQTR